MKFFVRDENVFICFVFLFLFSFSFWHIHSCEYWRNTIPLPAYSSTWPNGLDSVWSVRFLLSFSFSFFFNLLIVDVGRLAEDRRRSINWCLCSFRSSWIIPVFTHAIVCFVGRSKSINKKMTRMQRTWSAIDDNDRLLFKRWKKKN